MLATPDGHGSPGGMLGSILVLALPPFVLVAVAAWWHRRSRDRAGGGSGPPAE